MTEMSPRDLASRNKNGGVLNHNSIDLVAKDLYLGNMKH